MRIFLAADTANHVTSNVEHAITTIGHVVDVSDDMAAIPTSDLVILLVSGDTDAAAAARLLEVVTAARDADIALIGASACPTVMLPSQVRAISVEQGWIEVEPADRTFEKLLSAVQATEKHVAAASADGDHPAEQAKPAGKLTRSLSKLRTGIRRRSADVVESDATQAPAGSRVFVSYSRRDKLAEDVCVELRRHGHDVWIDKEGIPGGANWRDAIERQIRESDVVIVLLSSNVVSNPKYVRVEIGLAQNAGKLIVPALLERTGPLPEGFSFILGEAQSIPFYENFSLGMGRLLEAIGMAATPEELNGIGDHIRRYSQIGKRFAHQHDVAGMAKRYGGAALAGAVVVGGFAVKVLMDQQEAERQATLQRDMTARQKYGYRCIRLINDGLNQLQLTGDMTSDDYRRDIRQNMMRIIGKLEASRPEGLGDDLAERHDQIVRDMEALVEKFDRLFERLDRGATSGYNNAFAQLNDSWNNTTSSALAWLQTLYTG